MANQPQPIDWYAKSKTEEERLSDFTDVDDKGRPIHVIKKDEVERVLDSFIVDQVEKGTLSNIFSLDYSEGSEIVAKNSLMRSVNSPYTKYNVTPMDRGLLKALIYGEVNEDSIYNINAFFDILEHDGKPLKKKKSPKPKLPYNPYRSRKRKYPLTPMQVMRDQHGMIGVFDLNEAKRIGAEVIQKWGQFFSGEEMKLLKTVAVTGAYRNIYPVNVKRIRGKGQVWIVDDKEADRMRLKMYFDTDQTFEQPEIPEDQP